MKHLPKILIGVCNSQEAIGSPFFWSTYTINHTYPTSVARGDHPWDIVRNNRLIKAFLDSDCDIFVKMDIDQKYPDSYFESMVPLVEKYKVIGPLIFDRWMSSGFMPLAFSEHEYPGLKPFNFNGRGGVIRIPYTHTNNFYAREVLEKIQPPWYEAHLRLDGLDRANHVDFTFLDKVHNAGYSVYCNLDIVVEHLATVGVGKEFYAQWHK